MKNRLDVAFDKPQSITSFRDSNKKAHPTQVFDATTTIPLQVVLHLIRQPSTHLAFQPDASTSWEPHPLNQLQSPWMYHVPAEEYDIMRPRYLFCLFVEQF